MTASPIETLPPLPGTRFVTDGGMETDLIFHHGVELPHFAAFPLLDTSEGRELLIGYYDDYADIARQVGAGLMLETPTWRASSDWGVQLGYGGADLARVNTDAVDLLAALRERYAPSIDPILISGMIGPRGDGYSADDPLSAPDAADYHRPQLEAFAAAHADLATAYTLTHVGEAIGIVQAARSVGLPMAISFTVDTDGRLPSGDTVADAIATVDRAAPPAYYLINCAHPVHILRGLSDRDSGLDRIAGVRVNASLKSHAELDDADELDEGDIEALAISQQALTRALAALRIVGGCCGTDHRHVAAMWSGAEVGRAEDSR